MTTSTRADHIETLRIEQEIEINAGVEDVYASLLAMLGPESEMPDGSKFPMVFEAWPGGRWYRDLGKDTGHFWGHVQVIKPPPHPKPLIEITGPLFMSYPVISHVQYRILPDGERCILRLTHRAMGLIDPEHAQGVHEGWSYELSKIKEKAERVLA